MVDEGILICVSCNCQIVMKFDDCGKDRGINIWMGEKQSRRAPEATCSPEVAYSRYE